MKAPSPAAAYAHFYPILVEEGRKHGYAIALHGTMRRDIDVVAVPWTEDAASADDLAKAIWDQWANWGAVPEQPLPTPSARPHGRLSWSIVLFGHAYLDLSVMPRTP